MTPARQDPDRPFQRFPLLPHQMRDRGRPVERTGYVVGALLLASGLLHLAILIIGGGSWEGPLSFRKPTTFGLSFGLTLITITWVASFLPLGDRKRKVLLGAFTAACVVETALVSLQAWRGVPSHFNVETRFDALVARILAVGGLTLVVVIVALTVAAFRSNAAVPPSLTAAIRAGFVALVVAQLAGALMIARGMRLALSGDPQRAYASGGALKATHAATMHAILLLPLLAWLLSFVPWSEPRRLRTVLVATAGYAALAGAVAFRDVRGLEGRPVPTPMLALVALGSFLVLTPALIRGRP